MAPTTGERFFLELPYLHANMCPIFLDLAAHLDAVSHLLQAYDAPTPGALTGSTYLAEAIHALFAWRGQIGYTPPPIPS
jgi:hypothetical protein